MQKTRFLFLHLLHYRIFVYFALYGFFCTYTMAQNYTARLPDSIVLQNGENRMDTLTSRCGNQYCTFGSMGNAGSYSFRYSTSGGSSQLTLVSITPPNPYGYTHSVFYMGSLNIGRNSKLSINDFHTFAPSGTLTLGENATLEVILQKGQKIPASEFAPSSKVYFSRGANFFLESGSRFNVSNTDFVIINSQGTISNSAQMILDANTIRFQNTIHNYGTMELTGNVYNIGQSAFGINLATSNLINNGKMTINGNFYNGGIPLADSVTGSWWQNDAPSPGGGNLINYGGEITIVGQLINDKGTQLGHTQYSSVAIYGGSITATQGMQNATGNTLTFGAQNGKMGQLIGNLSNNGAIKVNLTGANLGTHQLITGTLSGSNTQMDFITNGGKSEFIESIQNSTTITLNKNTQAINAFMDTLPTQPKTILTALEENFSNPHTPTQQSIYTYGDRNYLSMLADNLNDNIESMLIYASPLSIWAMIQNNIIPLKAQITPLLRKTTFSIAPFSSTTSHSSLKSPLNGVSINVRIPYGIHQLSAFTTYANTNMTQSLDTSQTYFDTNSLALGLMDRIFLQGVEISLLAYSGATFNKTKRYLLMNNSSFQTHYSYYELGLSAQIGSPLQLNKLWIKPFVGIDYIFGLQSAFKESITSSTASATINAPLWTIHTPQLTLGTQMQYTLNNQTQLFGGGEIQYALTNPSFYADFGSSHLKFAPQNALGFTLYLGGSLFMAKNISASAYALYSRSHLAFQTYSGTLNLSYHF